MQRNFINIYWFLVNFLMHYYLTEVCILILSVFFSPPLVYFICATVCPYGLPPSFGELVWPPQTGLLAESGRWTAGHNRAVSESLWGSFWMRNTAEVQTIHSKELLSIHQHTVPGLLRTSQVSQPLSQQGCNWGITQCSFSTKSQGAFLNPIYLHLHGALWMS